MRLLLDEHYARVIAVRLREREFDVIATQEVADLRGSDDESLLAWAVTDCRALLTNNVGHFVGIARAWASVGRQHYGLLFTSEQSMPRSRRTVGQYVKVLASLMKTEPGDDALVDQIRWLTPPNSDQ